jgi:hypothetical protein
MSSLFTLTSFMLPVGKDLWRNGDNFPALKHWYTCLLIAFWSNVVHKLMLFLKQLQRHHMNRFRSDAIVKNDIIINMPAYHSDVSFFTPCWQAIWAFTIIGRESYKCFNRILGLEIRWFKLGRGSSSSISGHAVPKPSSPVAGAVSCWPGRGA